MYELDAIAIFVSFVVTWSIGLLPPIIIRYGILKRPIAQWPAIGTCVLLWVINLLLFAALGSQNKAHGALILIAFVSYWILRRGVSTKNEQEQKTTSVPAANSAIRNNSLNDESLSEERVRVSMELGPNHHGNHESMNSTGRINRTHDKYYEIAWDEIESGNKDKAVWAKAFSLADGVEDKARAIYISLRVSVLEQNQKSAEPKPSDVRSTESILSREIDHGDKIIYGAILIFILTVILISFFSF